MLNLSERKNLPSKWITKNLFSKTTPTLALKIPQHLPVFSKVQLLTNECPNPKTCPSPQSNLFPWKTNPGSREYQRPTNNRYPLSSQTGTKTPLQEEISFSQINRVISGPPSPKQLTRSNKSIRSFRSTTTVWTSLPLLQANLKLYKAHSKLLLLVWLMV